MASCMHQKIFIKNSLCAKIKVSPFLGDFCFNRNPQAASYIVNKYVGKRGQERMGGILYSKNGEIQESLQPVPREGKH